MAASVASGQDAPSISLATLQENAAKRTSEWGTLATNLEQRLTRLLPCDPRERTSLDEVSRASEARTLALTSYWTVLSARSKAQLEAVRALLAQEQERAPDWAKDQNDALTDVAFTDAQVASLMSSIRQLPALANPQKSLEGIGQLYRSLQQQAQERAGAAGPLIDTLRQLLSTSEARQAAVEDRLKSVSNEGLRWSGYYSTRSARAQIECSITSPAVSSGRAALPPLTPRPSAQGKNP